ncbi:MAG: hypothetical protein WC156_09865 [Pedobacter sp.]
MKSLITYLALLIAVCISSTTLAADIQMQTGFNFDWWKDNQTSRARQSYVPVRIDGRFDDFSITLLTAYAHTHLDKSGSSTTLDHVLDTKLNTSYSIIGKLPVDILLGLDLNLPTGKTDLTKKENELNLVMDPDLISITTYGEGFNVNPTVTIAKQWGKLVTGIGFGYLYRGEYNYSSELGISDYDPGDIISLTGEARYYFSPKMYTRLFVRHAWYEKDTLRGSDFYQEGDFSLFGLGLYYKQKKEWDAGLTFHGILRDKSKFRETSNNAFVTESHNGHGDEWIADLAAKYLLNEKTTLRSSLQGRIFTKNDYTPDSSYFIGEKKKLSLGIGATRALNPNLEAALDIKGFVKHDEETRFPEYKSACDYQGYSISAMLTGRF